MRRLVLVFACLIFVACADEAANPWLTGAVGADSGRSGRGDAAGTTPSSDAGTTPGSDAGTTPGSDASPAPGSDTGRPSIDAGTGGGVDTGTPGPSDSGVTAPGGEPGAACGCDSECEGSASNPGVCINGICMQAATTECTTDGSTAECGAGLRCWGTICYPDCASFSCAGGCDDDGSCVWTAESTCDSECSAVCEPDYDTGGGSSGGGCPPNSSPGDDGNCYCDEGFVVNADGTACVRECEADGDCSGGLVCIDNECVEPPCTADSCPRGTVCAESGACIADLGTVPSGTIPDCSGVADWMCEGGERECGTLEQFLPVSGPGYWNYPLNGESESNQYRSFCRGDLTALVKYAAAQVECLTGDWAFGNHQPLGLGDMSEADGAIPGTSIGSPGHPEGTHVDGYDMDIAYYQLSASDNRLRAVCDHVSGGADQYHCVSEPDDLGRVAFGALPRLLPRLAAAARGGRRRADRPAHRVGCRAALRRGLVPRAGV